MAIERLKFRCYRCNQLLGATPNKAGSVVTCPKCSAELLIPVPELRPDENSDIQARPAAPGRAKSRSDVRPKPDLEFAVPSEAIAAATAVQPAPEPPPPSASIDELAAGAPARLDRFETRRPARRGGVFREPHPPAAADARALLERAPWPPPELLEARALSEALVSPSPETVVVESPIIPSLTTVPPPVATQTVSLLPAPAESLTPPPVPQRAEAALIGASIEIEPPEHPAPRHRASPGARSRPACVGCALLVALRAAGHRTFVRRRPAHGPLPLDTPLNGLSSMKRLPIRSAGLIVKEVYCSR